MGNRKGRLAIHSVLFIVKCSSVSFKCILLLENDVINNSDYY